MTELLRSLNEAGRVEVLAAAAAVDVADVPVPAQSFRALADPALRAAVNEALSAAGRCLVQHDNGWLSGYRDDIADRLVEEGLGVLEPKDRAVLALVLLHTVAIPRARGRIDSEDWTLSEPTTLEELERNRLLNASDIRRSLRRLRTLGVLRYGRRPAIQPGPQFLRLTHERNARLSEELVLLCRPEGMLAQVIRRRRTERLSQETARA
ncbi:MAG: hypothetical protein M3417_08840 [Actinomycetota bacterium]|nr:hypothetical protein [Actinomycetota bacterium]